MIVLGTPVKDVITGFTGVAVIRMDCLTGCTQYGVSPTINKEGKIDDTQFFDETRLKTTGKPIQLVQEVKEKSKKDPGGPNRDLPRGRW